MLKPWVSREPGTLLEAAGIFEKTHLQEIKRQVAKTWNLTWGRMMVCPQWKTQTQKPFRCCCHYLCPRNKSDPELQ